MTASRPVPYRTNLIFDISPCAGTYHGMFHVEESAISEMQKWSPDVIVFLQGANDASRDKLEMFEVRLRRWLGHLTVRFAGGRGGKIGTRRSDGIEVCATPSPARAVLLLTNTSLAAARLRCPVSFRRGTSRRGSSRNPKSLST